MDTTTKAPIPTYGEKVTSGYAEGQSGIAKYDPNTGAALTQPTQTKTDSGVDTPTPKGYTTITNGVSTFHPTGTSSTSTVDNSATGLQGQENSLYNQQATLQNEANTASQNFQSTVKGIMNGSVPLTAPQQAQMTALQNSYQNIIKQQELTNKNFIAGTTALQANRGTAMYAPDIAKGSIYQATTEANQKIADLNSKMAGAVADLQEGFIDKNYNRVKDAYVALQDAQKARSDALDKLVTHVQTQEKALKEQQSADTLSQALAVLNDPKLSAQDRQKTLADFLKDGTLTSADAKELNTANMNAIIHSDTLSYQEKQQAIAQSQLSETQRHNKVQELISQETALKGVYNRDSDGTIYDTRTGKVISTPDDSLPIGLVTPGQTGNAIVDANTKYTSTGVPYVDGTNLTGGESTKAQLIAAKVGLPFLTKDGAAALNNISAAKNDFSLIKNEVDKLNPSVSLLGIWRLAVANIHLAEDITQSGPGANDISSYKTFRESAIKAIQALASGGAGLRINQAEISTMMDNIPSYNDTKGVAQGKLTKLNAMLDNNEKSLIGNKYFDQYNPNAAAADLQKYVQASPEHAAQVEALLQVNPNATDADIMSAVQP